MSRADDNGPVSVWRRWTDPDGVPFHRFCRFLPAEGSRHAVREPELRLFRGLIRQGLRYTPLVVTIVAVTSVIIGELSDAVVGLSATLPTLDPSVSPLMVLAGVAWIGLLLVPLTLVDVVPIRRIAGAVWLYGLVGVLAVGSVFAVLLTASPALVPILEAPDTQNPLTVLGGSGLLLLMLLGGMLVYDMALRIENVFSRLPEKSPPVVQPAASSGEEARTYDGFLAEFRDALDARIETPAIRGRRVRLRVAYIFAAVFLLPFILSRIYQYSAAGLGTVGPVDVAAAVLPTVLNVFLVVGFFQFLVLVTYFHRLLTRHGPDRVGDPTRFSLRYSPGHPDGYAGFRDLGRLATRVNTLLLLGGFYLAYRLYVLGLPALDALGPDPGAGAVLNWAVLFVGPLVAYLIGTVAWLYLSFWQLHRTMVRGREQCLRDALTPDTPFDVQDVRAGPVWPVNSSLLLSMVSVDAVPLLTLLPLL